MPPVQEVNDLGNTVVVSPDLGNAKEAGRFARILGGVPVAAPRRGERRIHNGESVSVLFEPPM